MESEFGGGRNSSGNVTAVIALSFFAADFLLTVVLLLRHVV
jgi:hypothetical protein